MKVVDANVLLDSVNSASDHHRAARAWMQQVLPGAEVIAFPWLSLVAFLRISTHPRIFRQPLAAQDATGLIEAWLRFPNAITPAPGPGHVATMRRLLGETAAVADLANDVHLAALAVEQRATVVTSDRDFGRFDGVTWRTPEQLLAER